MSTQKPKKSRRDIERELKECYEILMDAMKVNQRLLDFLFTSAQVYGPFELNLEDLKETQAGLTNEVASLQVEDKVGEHGEQTGYTISAHWHVNVAPEENKEKDEDPENEA